MNERKELEPTQVAKDFWHAITEIKIGMLVTLSREGLLRSRPMITQFIQKPDLLWFATKVEDSKTQEIIKCGHVNVCYCKPDEQTFISLSGEASVELDQAIIDKVMLMTDNDWASKEQDKSHLCLIKVKIKIAEFWDSEKGIMSHYNEFLEFTDRLGKKQRAPSQEIHEKIQLS
jgi:general stress protein 26